MRVIGVDVGSTSVKAVRVDGERVEAVACRPLDARLGIVPGRHEEDPEGVASAVENVLHEVATPSVEAICFTGQMHGGLLTDPGGRPLTPMITWQDQRAEPQAVALRAAGPWPGLGTDVYGGFLGPTVRWMHEAHVLPAGPWQLSGVYEWTAQRVLGIEPYTDPGSAAAWGLYDIEAGRWCDAALQACGVPRRALPPVCASGVEVGRVDAAAARRLGLRAGVVVVSGTGDTQASYLGSGCRPDEVLLNIGTGSQLLWESARFERPPGTDVRALPGGRFLIGLPTLAGGAAYARLADFVDTVLRAFGVDAARDQVYRALNEAAAATPPGAGGVRVTPLFLGSRTAGLDLRARIEGLGADTFTLANVSRAMLEGMIEELAAPYYAIAPDHQGMLGAGNAMRRNAALRDVAAARFRLSLRLSAVEEEAALGAARLAQSFGQARANA